MPVPVLRLALSAFAVLAFDASATVVSGVAGGVLTASSDGADSITITCAGGNVLVNGGIPGTGPATCGSITAMVLNGGPGGNVLSIATVNAVDFPSLASRTLNGGAGNDTLSGSGSADLLDGGPDIDLVDGNQGSDTANLGTGDDTFVWNPGDGSDVVNGDAGTDLLQFDGSAGSEIFAFSASGARFTLTRNVGNIVMDVGGVEQARVNALGGADSITLGHLAGTSLVDAFFDLSPTLGVGGGDAAADAVIVNASAAADTLQAIASGVQVLVSGGPVALTVANSEAANDTLVLNGLGGNDALSALGNLAALVRLTMDGGDDDDTLLGGNGADIFLGGLGNDLLDGNQGNDTAFLGDGADTFNWDPGDGSDIVEGQGGRDTLRFNGSAGAEIFATSANGGRVLFTRNVGNIVMDVDDVERLELAAFGGADALTVNDLAGTDLSAVAVDLGVGGGGDAAIDTLSVPGTVNADTISVTGTPAAIAITRADAVITIAGAEAANDTVTIDTAAGADTVSVVSTLGGALALLNLVGGTEIDTVRPRGTAGNDTINVVANGAAVDAFGADGRMFTSLGFENAVVDGLDGNDSTSATGNLAALIAMTVDGGGGDDVLLGGNGADVILGGDGADFVDAQQGNDTVFLGGGDDVFRWDPGDGSDVVEGQDGADRMQFNGSAGAEIFAASANGGRVLFTRNLGSIIMDLDDVEGIDLAALASADIVNVNALDGTDLVDIEVDLSAGGVGDAAIDAVNVNGTAGNDIVTTTPVAGGLALARLGRTVSVVGAEAANDTTTLDTLAGDDVLTVAIAATAGLQRFTWEAGLQGGFGDQLIVAGTAAAEGFTIAPNAGRLAVARAGGGAVDANAVERLQLAADAGADTVNTQGSAAISQVLDGGAPASFPGDVLMVSGFAGDPSVSPIVVPGALPITHAGFEFGPTGGRVRGRTFDDLDRDGVSDAGEPALAGLTVFDDANGNRFADPGETTAVTAADGTYELAFADEGSTVDVRVVPPAGRVQTSADPATILLNGNTTVSNIDIGFTAGTLIEAFPTGWQETPPNASSGTGYGYAALYEPSNEAVFVLSFSGLGSANTLTHVHGPAARGVAASPIIDLPSSGATSGSLRVGPMVLTPTQVSELKAGLWYYNVHTTTFPGGEIRGQLDNALFKDSFE